MVEDGIDRSTEGFSAGSRGRCCRALFTDHIPSKLELHNFCAISNETLLSSPFSGLLVRRCHRTASATTTTSLMLSDLQAPVAARPSGYTLRAPTYRGTTLVKQVSTPEKPHYSQNPPLFYGLNEQNPQPVFIVTLAWFL